MKIKYWVLILGFFTSLASLKAASREGVLEEMCRRLFPEHADSFYFECTKGEKDRVVLQTRGGKVILTGNNNNSLAVGLNHYLKKYCHSHVSWFASDRVTMPDKLPRLPEKVVLEAKCDNRFFLNYCTFGYTMPYWQWGNWERLIDWMALNGVTMPLAITGQESIWYRVWTKLGLTDEQVRSYFTGPAHLPWHRMSNIDRWQSPLPVSWLKHQEKLQKRILERERSFDMRPVLPAFSGHVPGDFQQVFPDAKIYQMSKWGGFDEPYRSYFIDPADSLYAVIQRMFLEEQTQLYGTNHIYGSDPFNEIDSPDWSEAFLSDVSGHIYKSMTAVDPQAKWLQMTWMFYYDKEKWTQSRIRAFLRGVPQDQLILLDYYCDFMELWDQTELYYGQPYFWCYLGNFGGNTMLAGDLDDIDHKINRVLKEGGPNLAGVGATLEGFDVNPLMYEFVLDKVWQSVSVADWVRSWAMRRGGAMDEHIQVAWADMYAYIYTKPVISGQGVLMNARPQLEGIEGWNTHPEYHYDNQILWKIWQELLKAQNVRNRFYSFDVVNVGRQVLGNLFSDFRTQFTGCYHKREISGLRAWAARMDSLLLDVDRLLACDDSFSFEKWVQDARAFGTSKEEEAYYERNARTLLTVWGQKGAELNDYANRGWSGLTRNFYRERWKRFTDVVILSVEKGIAFDELKFRKEIIEFEWEWTLQEGGLGDTISESAQDVAHELSKKYASYLNEK